MLERSGGNCFEVKFNNEAEVAYYVIGNWFLIDKKWRNCDSCVVKNGAIKEKNSNRVFESL